MSRLVGVLAVLGATMAILVLPGGVQASPDVCVSVDGVVRVDQGASECVSTEGQNVAVATNDSGAFAGNDDDGTNNVAIATNGSEAGAGGEFGSGNTSVAVNASNANSSEGDDNTAIAVNDSFGNDDDILGGAFAEGGNNNRATAVNTSLAVAEGGDNNTAKAINESCAEATGGDQTDIAINESTVCEA